ncbi:GNAT family N-acetyltransferase [Actinopolymorpha sp. B9G3]|uniref:GNAT family N-acetyltransferase n=1 Tax=Actinopolymorpha sp. B9G3 TaxID=3158970 RepID=UPI0032D92176
MPPALTLAPILADDRPVVERLWQLYSHDLSEFRGELPTDEGLYSSGRLPLYFDDPDRCGYLIHTDSGLAGFALVRGLSGEARVMGEFFVVRAARRQRVGHAAATELLSRHRGLWEIPFQEANPAAARFWRRVATAVAGSAWKDERRPIPGKPDLPPDIWLLLTA